MKLKPTITIFAAAIGFIACKKENTSTDFNSIIGKWNLVETGRDLNGDNQMSANETDSAANLNVGWEMELMEDHNYVQRSNAFGTAAGKWIQFDDKFMTMTNLDTATYQLSTQEKGKMTLYHSGEQSASTWYVFKKQ